MNQTALVFMAAGIGSRFGGGIKQLAPVDPMGHIIMDYSIHDAIEAGFNQIIFIIRRDIADDFKEVIGNRIEAVCAQHNVRVGYCFQSLEEVPGAVPEGRTKPWGTGQAVLAARNLVNCPFAVLNADDYYGKQAFREIHDFLSVPRGDTEFCMAGFVLKNTLSDNGGVTRGICQMDDAGYLSQIAETRNIVQTSCGAAADGKTLDAEGLVSMNMWGLSPAFMAALEENFKTFFEKEVPGNPLKSEYLLPVLIGDLLEKKELSVKVLKTHDKWFGVTYAEDKAAVMQSFEKLLADGVYAADLYSDLK